MTNMKALSLTAKKLWANQKCDRRTDGQTDRRRTKWSLSGALPRWCHKKKNKIHVGCQVEFTWMWRRAQERLSLLGQTLTSSNKKKTALHICVLFSLSCLQCVLLFGQRSPMRVLNLKCVYDPHDVNSVRF